MESVKQRTGDLLKNLTESSKAVNKILAFAYLVSASHVFFRLDFMKSILGLENLSRTDTSNIILLLLWLVSIKLIFLMHGFRESYKFAELGVRESRKLEDDSFAETDIHIFVTGTLGIFIRLTHLALQVLIKKSPYPKLDAKRDLIKESASPIKIGQMFSILWQTGIWYFSYFLLLLINSLLLFMPLAMSSVFLVCTDTALGLYWLSTLALVFIVYSYKYTRGIFGVIYGDVTRPEMQKIMGILFYITANERRNRHIS